MSSFRENFISRLRVLRGKQSQDSFSKKLGIPQTTYSNFERGAREVGLEFLAEISIRLGVSADWLLGLTDERTPGVSIKAGDGSAVAANRSTATVQAAPAAASGDVARLIGIIESQQAVIAALTGAGKKE